MGGKGKGGNERGGMMKGKGKGGGKKSKKKKGKGGKEKGGTVLVASGITSELEVVACDPDTVEIQGERAAEAAPGIFFVYVAGDVRSCTGCSPLFRKIVSVADGDTEGTKILTTTFASFGEIFGVDSVDEAVVDELVEPLAGCSHSGGGRRGLSDVTGHQDHRKLQPFPSTCDAWQQKNSDGRCTYTDCFVGENGSTTDCFVCKGNCDNGCGKKGSTFNTDGNFGFFDFGEACCIHDHCYSSIFDKGTCDSSFYDDMKDQCDNVPLVVVILEPNLSRFPCEVSSTLFYFRVQLPTDDAASEAKKKQDDYEKTDVCVAPCPSTQQSGGQGTTRLVIDLLQSSGTFPVEYQMYQIPDQLYITYEGTRIFDTNGLVSGSQSAQVSYSGNSTLVEVTIFAPNDGTRWDVFVGCPAV